MKQRWNIAKEIKPMTVSSSCTLVKRDVTSYDTIMSLLLNEVLRISSANLNVSVIVCSLMDNGFNFSSSHFARS